MHKNVQIYVIITKFATSNKIGWNMWHKYIFFCSMLITVSGKKNYVGGIKESALSIALYLINVLRTNGYVTYERI